MTDQLLQDSARQLYSTIQHGFTSAPTGYERPLRLLHPILIQIFFFKGK